MTIDLWWFSPARSGCLALHFGVLFFFTDTATTEIYTLSLHDALPICSCAARPASHSSAGIPDRSPPPAPDRKSTRLNSSHEWISYAVFCLKKKNPQDSLQVDKLMKGVAAVFFEANGDGSTALHIIIGE